MGDRWTSFEVCIKHPSTQGQDDVYSLLEKLLDAGQKKIVETADWKISQSLLIETVGEDKEEEEDDFEFEDIEVKNDRFILTLEYIGEGTSGDYDPSDEKDIRLLRYTLQEKIDGEWEEVNDGSACTLLDATERREYLELAAQGMLNYITKHSPANEVNEQALQNLSHADLVGIKAKLRLPKIK